MIYIMAKVQQSNSDTSEQQFTPEEDALWKAINAYIASGDLETAVERFDDIAAISNIPHFYMGIKAKLQRQLNQIDEALITVERGLRLKPDYYEYLQIKGEILFGRGLNSVPVDKELMDQAIQLIIRAENSYSQFETSTPIDTYIKDSPGLQWWVTNLVHNRVTLSSTRFSMETLRNINDIYGKISDLESKTEGEKVRQFEQLALFAAIFALIVSNVQMIPKLNLSEILILNAGLVLTFVISLSLGSMVLGVANMPSQPLFRQWRFWLAVSAILLGILLYQKVK